MEEEVGNAEENTVTKKIFFSLKKCNYKNSIGNSKVVYPPPTYSSPRVAPKKSGPPTPWGLDTLGGHPLWTKILFQTQNDLGGNMVKMEDLIAFL